MKVTLGIIGIALSLLFMLQSCALTGIASLAEEEDIAASGAIGVLAAFIFFLGSAFIFGGPRASVWLFAAATLLALLGSQHFTDLSVWAAASVLLALLVRFLVINQEAKSKSE